MRTLMFAALRAPAPPIDVPPCHATLMLIRHDAAAADFLLLPFSPDCCRHADAAMLLQRAYFFLDVSPMLLASYAGFSLLFLLFFFSLPPPFFFTLRHFRRFCCVAAAFVTPCYAGGEPCHAAISSFRR